LAFIASPKGVEGAASPTTVAKEKTRGNKTVFSFGIYMGWTKAVGQHHRSFVTNKGNAIARMINTVA
jgi:hypothetical protein